MEGIDQRRNRDSAQATSPIALASILFVAAAITFSLYYLLPSLYRSWFFSSDEYAIAQEVIRFLNLDSRQQFFDMPGTPLMMLSAAIWAAIYGVAGTHSAGILGYTFQHLDGLFAVMRGVTLFFYATSLILVFLLARRLMNTAGACIAGLLVAMSPAYASYSSFCRVESMSISLILLGLLITHRALDRTYRHARPRRFPIDPFLVAGVLAGLAAAVRLHSLLASMPLLALILLFHKWNSPPEDYPRWMRSTARIGLPLMAMAGAATIWEVKTRFIGYPHASALIVRAGVALLVLPMLVALFYTARRTRSLLLRAAGPEFVKIIAGCTAGFLLGSPTSIRQYTFVLASIDRYSGSYIDWQRTAWPLKDDVAWYLYFYGKTFAPDAIAALLLLTGAMWMVLRRDRRMLPYLCAFLIFFVSQPLDLRAAHHHILLWLPFFALVCAYPIAETYGVLWHRAGTSAKWKLAVQAAAVLAWLGLAWQLTNGPRNAASEVRASQLRLDNVAEATSWIKRNTGPGATIAVGYFCFNPDMFYAVLRAGDVPVPDSVSDGRYYFGWWGERASLAGHAGYVCAPGPGAAGSNLDRLAVADSSRMVDPLTDPAFHKVAGFGSGAAEVDIFQFDLRDPPPPK